MGVFQTLAAGAVDLAKEWLPVTLMNRMRNNGGAPSGAVKVVVKTLQEQLADVGNKLGEARASASTSGRSASDVIRQTGRLTKLQQPLIDAANSAGQHSDEAVAAIDDAVQQLASIGKLPQVRKGHRSGLVKTMGLATFAGVSVGTTIVGIDGVAKLAAGTKTVLMPFVDVAREGAAAVHDARHGLESLGALGGSSTEAAPFQVAVTQKMPGNYQYQVAAQPDGHLNVTVVTNRDGSSLTTAPVISVKSGLITGQNLVKAVESADGVQQGPGTGILSAYVDFLVNKKEHVATTPYQEGAAQSIRAWAKTHSFSLPIDPLPEYHAALSTNAGAAVQFAATQSLPYSASHSNYKAAVPDMNPATQQASLAVKPASAKLSSALRGSPAPSASA